MSVALIDIDEMRRQIREAVRAELAGKTRPPVLTLKQLALEWQVSRQAIMRCVCREDNPLPVHALGEEYRFLRHEVDGWSGSPAHTRTLSERPVQAALMPWLKERGHEPIARNVRYEIAEADVMSVHGGRAVECEIKTSLDDFKHDAKKTAKHERLAAPGPSAENLPALFYYVLPGRWASVGDIPEHYGLITFSPDHDFTVVQEATVLHTCSVGERLLRLIENKQAQ